MYSIFLVKLPSQCWDVIASESDGYSANVGHGDYAKTVMTSKYIINIPAV